MWKQNVGQQVAEGNTTDTGVQTHTFLNDAPDSFQDKPDLIVRAIRQSSTHLGHVVVGVVLRPQSGVLLRDGRARLTRQLRLHLFGDVNVLADEVHADDLTGTVE